MTRAASWHARIVDSDCSKRRVRTFASSVVQTRVFGRSWIKRVGVVRHGSIPKPGEVTPTGQAHKGLYPRKRVSDSREGRRPSVDYKPDDVPRKTLFQLRHF